MKIGFIGAGNMGGAIIGSIINSKLTAAENITVADRCEAKLDELKTAYGVTVTQNNRDTLTADILILAVKPNVIYSVIDEIKADVSDNTVIVSIAAGQSIEKLKNAFGRNVKLVRVMPNTPALVGEGMAAVTTDSDVSDNDIKPVLDIFNSAGKAQIVPEKLMDTVTAVSGSSPAYVFMFIEAMADAAVKGGMARDMAYTFAAQSVLGSAKMVLETGKHPAELKDMVCSPAGTTIDAVAVLEEKGMRSAVMSAMKACIEKSESM